MADAGLGTLQNAAAVGFRFSGQVLPPSVSQRRKE